MPTTSTTVKPGPQIAPPDVQAQINGAGAGAVIPPAALADFGEEGLDDDHLRVGEEDGREFEQRLLAFPAVLVVFYDPESSVGLNPKHKEVDFAWQLSKRGFVTLSIGTPSHSWSSWAKLKTQLANGTIGRN